MNSGIATYSEFQRSLLLREQCGQYERVQEARKKGFLVWRRGAIQETIEHLERLRERAPNSIWADITETIEDMESQLEEFGLLFTHA